MHTSTTTHRPRLDATDTPAGVLALAVWRYRQRTGADRVRFRVVCLECGRRFRSSALLPECPGCSSSDVELD